MKHLMFIFLLCATFSYGQDVDDPQPQNVDPRVKAKIEAARIALITERLGLTPEQAEKFWPIYREFTQKRMEIRQEFQSRQREVNQNNPDPKQQQELVNFGLQLKQRELDMEKDYSNRIMQVITAQQLLNLRRAEQDFRQMIINQLQQRRAGVQQRKEMLRDQNQRLREKRK